MSGFDKIESTVWSVLDKFCFDGATLAVGLSGGEDSMCLISVLLRVWDKNKIKAVHVQHGIRGDSSLADAAFVENFCRENGIELFRFDADIPSMAQKSGSSLESEARLYRKKVFADILSEKKADFLLLAHHRLDCAESVLMHVFRGSGTNGLRGMSECDGKIVRPLASIDKSEISSYVKDHGISFCVDETNSDTAYNRNFIRKKVIPLVNERYDVVAAAEKLSSLARADDDFICSLIPDDDFTAENDRCSFAVTNLCKPYALASRYALFAAKKAGLVTDVEKKHVDEIIALSGKQNGKSVALPHGYRAAREYEKITVYKAEEIGPDCIPYAEGITAFGDGCVFVLPAEKKFVKGEIVFDGDKIPDGAEIRFRKEGDTFKPFGSGTKKLKEYFIDEKIPARYRNAIPLICKDSRVLAIAGIQISDDVKITEKTRNIMKFSYEKE